MKASVVVLLLGIFSGGVFGLKNSPLGPYNISDVTVSGLSSGGFMTAQVHVAFSSIIKAAAVFAGVSVIRVIFCFSFDI
jgi:hypothetical protein